MMYHHLILVASSYTKGQRIGFHLVKKERINKIEFQSIMDKVIEIQRSDIGVHSLSTESDSWESIVKLDSFFKDVVVCSTFEKFEEILNLDLTISAVDIAKFFLSIKPFSHLQIQKLVYIAYKEYLLKYKQPLFQEKILAYRYGPVIEELYKIFKKYGAKDISIENTPDEAAYLLKGIDLPQAISRMRLSKKSEQIIPLLLDVFKTYGHMSGGELIDFTHIEHSPWSTVYREGLNQEITDDVIFSQAQYEVL